MKLAIPILIPAYNPDERLIALLHSLSLAGVGHIVVVDDGSESRCAPVFEKVQTFKNCRLLTHAVNMGKGRALKTGLNDIYLHFPGTVGVVTADCDGQHTPEDILNIAAALAQHPQHLIIGSRKMVGKVPFRSLFGNLCTRAVFSFVIGRKVLDTQSGLRGLPRVLIPQLLTVTGERYEFEINMLIFTRVKAISILEIPINTIYLEDNKSSHFNPFFDSMKIYFQLLRFAFSSLLASFFDFIVFTLLYNLTGSIMAGLLVGRFVIGSLLNYVVNRRLVFHSHSRVAWSLVKYYLALVLMSFISFLLIDLAREKLGLSVIPAKIVVESLLFVVSFSIQREFVFTGAADETETEFTAP